MAHFCQTHQFQWSKWNRLGDRRIAVMMSRQMLENRLPEDFAEIKITPGDAYFVRTEELCTTLDTVVLEYHLEPAVQEVSEHGD